MQGPGLALEGSERRNKQEECKCKEGIEELEFFHIKGNGSREDKDNEKAEGGEVAAISVLNCEQ